MVKKVVKYLTDDGTEHETKEAARAHESIAGFKLLEKMSAADIENAISGKDVKRRELFLRVGYAIRDARLAAGEVKHRKQHKPEPTADLLEDEAA